MNAQIIPQPELSRGTRGGYKWNGEPLDRVTTILGLIEKPALLGWAARCAVELIGGIKKPEGDGWLVSPSWAAGKTYTQQEINEVLAYAAVKFRKVSQMAADYGTEAHAWIEQHGAGLKPAMPTEPHVKASVAGYLEWAADHKLELVKSEWMIADPVEHVGGMLDRLVYVDGELTLLDFKTGKPANKKYNPDGLYPEQKMQVNAYYHIAAPLIKGDTIKHRLILQIPKDGQPVEVVEVTTDPDESWVGFVGLIRARQALLGMGWNPYGG